MKTPRTVVGRGMVAGAAGATVLALWFLLGDLRQGEPFRTPIFLAEVLGLGTITAGVVSVTVYTLVHYLLFMAVGVAATWIAERLEAVPGVILGLVLGVLLFNLIFYGSVWITGIDVVRQLGWPRVLVGNILAGLAVFTALAVMGSVQPVRWRELFTEHYIIREGLAVGLVGAVAVAIWFLIVDAIGGRLLFTPAALGSAVLLGARGTEAVEISTLTVLGYTLIHVTAFVIAGLVAAGIVAAAEEYSEAVLLGGVLLLVTFETFSIGILTIIASWLLEALAWWNIAAANVIAALTMGAYLYHNHPGLARDMRERDLEEDLAHDVPAPGHAPHVRR